MLVDIGESQGETVIEHHAVNTDWILRARTDLFESRQIGTENRSIFFTVLLSTPMPALVVSMLLRRRADAGTRPPKARMATINEPEHAAVVVKSAFFRETRELDQFIGEQSMSISELIRELEQQARHDPLTGR